MRATGPSDGELRPQGIVTALHRLGCVVDHAGQRWECKREKGADLCVGDAVILTRLGTGRATIAERLPRRSWFARGVDGGRRTKLVAANVDILAIVVAAAEPTLQPGLIDRFFTLARVGRMEAFVCMNKMDLADAASVDAVLDPFGGLGVPTFRLVATRNDGVAALRAAIQGRRVLFCGHSGVGKSTLINALVGARARLRTGEVSGATGKGVHTTAWVDWIELAPDTVVIDTPGVKQVSLGMLGVAEMQQGYPEFAAFAAACRFADCTHLDERDCAVRAASARGDIGPARYARYRAIVGQP